MVHTVSTVITTIHTDMNPASLLHLLHVSSPALPIGAFAYSQGLEYALDTGWCSNADDVSYWLDTVLRYGIGQLDLPVLVRLHQAWATEDKNSVVRWNDELLAYRETKELYLEDTQVGEAFRQWHMTQSQPDVADKLEWLNTPSYAAMFALHSVLKGVGINECLLGFSWAWLENQIAAASKAMPMGQTDGQSILSSLIPVIEEVVNTSMHIMDEDIGSGLFGLATASAMHEHQYSRLFRS